MMNWREKWKKKWKYISNRVQVLGVLCLAALSISGAVQLAAAKTGADVFFTTGCLTLLAGAALAAAFWGWVVRPYREHEKVEKRFLAGYMFSEEDLERAVLTPTMREEMEMMEKIIRSPQLMDLNKRQAQYLALQNQINPHFQYAGEHPRRSADRRSFWCGGYDGISGKIFPLYDHKGGKSRLGGGGAG